MKTYHYISLAVMGMAIVSGASLGLVANDNYSKSLGEEREENIRQIETSPLPLISPQNPTANPVAGSTGVTSLAPTTSAPASVPQSAESAAPTQSLTAQNPSVGNVTIFHTDNRCQGLVSEEVAIAESTPEAAVGVVLEKEETGDFSIAGYRVNVNSQTGTATVDLRLPTNAQRPLTALSTCEQLALFGSIRRTLTANSAWQIREVVFTEQGQPVIL